MWLARFRIGKFSCTNFATAVLSVYCLTCARPLMGVPAGPHITCSRYFQIKYFDAPVSILSHRFLISRPLCLLLSLRSFDISSENNAFFNTPDRLYFGLRSHHQCTGHQHFRPLWSRFWAHLQGEQVRKLLLSVLLLVIDTTYNMVKLYSVH